MNEDRTRITTPVIALLVCFGILTSWDVILGYNEATTIVTLFGVVCLAGASVYWIRTERTVIGATEENQVRNVPLATKLRLAANGDRESRLDVASYLVSLAREKGMDGQSINRMIENEISLGGYRKPKLTSRIGALAGLKKMAGSKDGEVDYISSVASVVRRLGEVE